MIDPAAIDSSGAAMLARWRAAVGRYSATRDEFTAHAARVPLTQAQSAYVAELDRRAAVVESAIAKVAEWLHYGRDVWGAVQPLAQSAGLAGTARKWGPLAGLGVLALALKYLDGITLKLADANRHMAALESK